MKYERGARKFILPIEILSCHFSGRTEEKHEHSESPSPERHKYKGEAIELLLLF
jgi:hypothetical protein